MERVLEPKQRALMYDVLNKKYQSHIKSRNIKSSELFFL